MAAVLDIVAFSDDEGQPQAFVQAPAAPAPGLNNAVAPTGTKRRLQASPEEIKHSHSRKLHNVMSQKCKCKFSRCRAPWKDDPAAFDELLELRLRLQELPKLDADEETFDA